MSAIPHDPEEFFGQWLPRSFAAVTSPMPAQSAPGAVVFAVGARPPFSLRWAAGKFELAREVPADTIVQVTLSENDFVPVVVRGAELVNQAEPERKLVVLRALTLDAERLATIREVRGSLALLLNDGSSSHRVVLTPGTAKAELDAPACTIRFQLQDFLALQRGETNPFELMMNGKLQITGDAQLPLSLSGLLM